MHTRAFKLALLTKTVEQRAIKLGPTLSSNTALGSTGSGGDAV
jgi:hypothetical protein